MIRVHPTLTNLTSKLDFRAALGAGDIQELDYEYELTLKAPGQIKRRGGELTLLLHGAARAVSTPDEN